MKESPLYARTYDLLLWLIPQTNKFPRVHRFGLAEKIQNVLFAFQDNLIAAGKARSKQDKLKKLQDADVQLEQLRVWIRLSRDLDIIQLNQYEHVSRMVSEVGRLLGAWIKKLMASPPLSR